MRDWTEKEDELLRKTYADMPLKKLMEMLNRSKNSIYGRADALKLQKRQVQYIFSKDPYELGYLAGLIDGEGSINIIPRPYHCIRLRISNTSFEVIDWLHKRFGGAVSNVNVASKGENRKPQKCWTLKASKAVQLLEKVLPCLIVKNEHAKVALMFQSRISWPNKSGTKPLVESEILIREKYRLNLKNLNKRGKE